MTYFMITRLEDVLGILVLTPSLSPLPRFRLLLPVVLCHLRLYCRLGPPLLLPVQPQPRKKPRRLSQASKKND